MDLTAAFAALQNAADADPDAVAEARRRRALFRGALTTEDDVTEVVYSGSLARSTQRDPLNDVDVVAVYDAGRHPEWGADGDSAADALDHTQEQIHRLLGATDGSYDQAVRLARPRNHAVKCWLDDPDDPDAFTVDVMPALRHPDGGLLVPEKLSRTWIRTDPEHLIAEVARRHGDWDRFRPLVRVLKRFNDDHGKLLKSLTMEVLALTCLREEPTTARALQKFFQAASIAVLSPIVDPAGLCGEIQPGLDRDAASALLDEAASHAWHAVNLEEAGDTDGAACRWRRVFGEAFPEPEGGCPLDEPQSGLAGFAVGGAAGVAGAIGTHRPRKVIDSPQG